MAQPNINCPLARPRRRRGMNLTEIIMAIAIAAGPLLYSVQMISSNAKGARFNRERATARLILLDLATLLMGEPSDDLAQRLEPGSGDDLNSLLEERILRLRPVSPVAEAGYREEAKPIGKITGSLTEDFDPSLPGLARLTLTAPLSDDKNAVILHILFRPKARDYLRETQYEAAAQGTDG